MADSLILESEAYTVTTILPDSTVTAKVSTLSLSSFSTVTSYVFTRHLCGSNIDFPFLISNSQPCQGHRMISPSRPQTNSPGWEGIDIPVTLPWHNGAK